MTDVSAINTSELPSLPLFSGTSWEDHVSSWFETGQMIEDGLWLRGAIAASLNVKYGEDSIEKFAGEVMATARTIRQYRQVYRFYQNGARAPFLSFRHHLVAMYAPDPAAALKTAEDDGLSARNMAELFRVRVPATGDELPLLLEAHVSHNSGENEWYTPDEYITAAREVLGVIDLDPASSKAANKRVKAKTYYTIENDGLSKPWAGRVWMNPPYASDLVTKFVAKLAEHVNELDVTEAIVLVNNATETAWFRVLASLAGAIIFPNSRVKFIDQYGAAVGAPLQGQAVVYVGDKPKVFAEKFSKFGWTAWL